jgi:hypothetical protein
MVMVMYIESEIARLRERQRCWQKKYDAVANIHGAAKPRGQARGQLKVIREKIEVLMKNRALEYTPPMQSNQWPWRFWETQTIDGVRYGRGSLVPDAVLTSRNADTLIRGGYIRQLPSQPKSEPRSVQAKPAAPTSKPSSYVEQLRKEMQRIAASRGCSLIDAEDLVDRGLFQRALKEYCDLPHEIIYGLWGGNPTKTQTGAGSAGMRRIPEGFREHVLSGVSP